MKYAIVIFAIMALFAGAVSAGAKGGDPNWWVGENEKKGLGRKVCSKGKKKNGKCVRSVLRVRSADSAEFFEIPDVEDAHWGQSEVDVEEI